MTSPHEAPADPDLLPGRPPALRLLLGDSAGDLWTAVLGPLGGTLHGLRTTGVGLQPDGAATAQYSADVSWSDGRRTREALAATTGSRIPPGAAVIEGATPEGPVTVGAWRWPLDPGLPALSWATRAVAVADRLAELGLRAGPARLRLRAYRPGRRAVVEVTLPDRRLFLKVVRPSALDRLVERHEVLRGSVPAPPVLARTDDGVVVLPALPGTPMRDLLRGDGAGLPAPTALADLLAALPEAAADVAPRTRAWPGDALGRVGDHAAVLGTVLPALRPRLDVVIEALAAAERGTHDPVPTHGDFYESQLLVTDGAISGLLDVDTVGPGHRIDDWANLLAHLVLLERILPDPRATSAYRRQIAAHLSGWWPQAQLRPRIAAVLLGLATGPFRVQQAGWPGRTQERLTLAEEWARSPDGR